MTMKQYLLILLLPLLTFMGCKTDVDLFYETEQSHDALIQFKYDWKDTNKQFIPKEMTVLGYRVINMQKSAYAINTADNKGYILETVPGDTLPNFKYSSELLDTFPVTQGYYKFITLNMECDELLHNSVREYILTPEMNRDEVKVLYKTYSGNSPNLRIKIPSYTDHNNYSDFLQYTSSAVFYDTLTTREFKEGEHYELTFSPRELTQQVDLYFSIKKNISVKSFTVDSVYLELSGIPNSFYISTGELDIVKTYKMMFKTDTIIDRDKTTKVNCHAQAHIPGIVPNSQKDFYMGPGILQVMIFCSTTEDNKPKKIQGKMNLYNTLKQTPSIKIVKGNRAVHTTSKLKLNIQADLTIDGEKVFVDTDLDSGIDRWVPGDYDLLPVDI